MKRKKKDRACDERGKVEKTLRVSLRVKTAWGSFSSLFCPARLPFLPAQLRRSYYMEGRARLARMFEGMK